MLANMYNSVIMSSGQYVYTIDDACSPVDVIMDMLCNGKMREAILQYYEESGDYKAVFEAVKQSQEMITVQEDKRLISVVLGNKR